MTASDGLGVASDHPLITVLSIDLPIVWRVKVMNPAMVQGA